ncbi:MAG: hypothetical protein HUK03_04330 [Bacteroidaceae bacterium]|nr:hypothetical protein [Bacteroidaceae bacterium]
MRRHNLLFPSIAFAFVMVCIAQSFMSCGEAKAEEPVIDTVAHERVNKLVYTNSHDEDALKTMLDSFIFEDDYFGISVCARVLGGVYRNKSEYTLSHKALRTSLKYAYRLQDTLELIQTYNYIATTFRRQGILDSASNFHYNALVLCNQYSKIGTRDGLKNKAITINGLGNIFMMYKHYQMADSLFHISLECERAIGSEKGVALNLAQIGNIKADNDELDSAMVYYQQAVAMNRADRNTTGTGISLNQIGSLLLKQERFAEAEDTLRTSYDLLLQSGDRMQWLRPCISLGKLCILTGRLDKAQHYLDTAQIVADQIESSKQMGKINFLRSELYKRRGDYRLAFHYLEQGCIYEDSLRAMDNQQVTYQREQLVRQEHFNAQMEVKDDMIEAERMRHRTAQKYALAFFVMFIIIGLTLYALSRQRYIAQLKREKHIVEMARSEALEAKRKAEWARQLAESASRMKTSFLQSISHELRTPLNAIQGFTDVLAEQGDVDVEERLQCTKMIHRSTRNLVTIVDDMLQFAELESGVHQVIPGHVSFEEAFDNLSARLSMLGQDGVKLLLGEHVTPSTMVKTDQSLFMKVLENYMSNALKYTAKGSVVVDMEMVDGVQRLTVTDTGPGVRQEYAEKIFEHFEKLGSFVQGNGLGLTIVRLIADCLKGKAYVDTSYTEGARFVFDFPIMESKE